MQSSSPPPAPNASQVSAAQTGSNIQSAIANTYLGNPNLRTPNGNWTTAKTGSVKVGGQSVPRFTQKLQLSPIQRQINTQNNLNARATSRIAGQQINRLGGMLGQPVTTDGLPDLTTSVNQDWSADRQRVEDALMSRLNPQLQQDTNALTTRLANQGIMPGSEAYNREMNLRNQATTDARMQAILAGGQEQSRLFDISKQAGAFGNAARQQAWSERLQERNQPINEVTALASGAQIASPGQPNFASGMVQPTNVAGNIYDSYNAQLQNYNMQQNQQNAMLGGLFGLGGAAISGGLFG